ncbi:MAG: FHA domain-containing protein [Nocardioides sp.]|uniref:FHA domain-containing protein n=1 Tax=Nocardioides sp. TaxID=35761 RepID=UPI0039E36740
MSQCPACGSQNPESARFCSQCGSALPPPSDSTATIQLGGEADTSERVLNPVDAAAIDGLPQGSAMLVVQRGPGSGSRFLLDRDQVHVGRHPDSDIFLDDVTVSRRHADFARTGDTFTVTDAGSLNGTYVNRDRIDEVALKDGDEVQIGKFRLVFYTSHQDA